MTREREVVGVAGIDRRKQRPLKRAIEQLTLPGLEPPRSDGYRAALQTEAKGPRDGRRPRVLHVPIEIQARNEVVAQAVRTFGGSLDGMSAIGLAYVGAKVGLRQGVEDMVKGELRPRSVSEFAS